MKKILLATALLVTLTTGAFADGKKTNAKFFGDLKTSLKNVNESAWQTTEIYRKTSFSLNDKKVNAYVSNETGDLIGFAIDIDKASLPEGTMQSLEKYYKGWQAFNPIMFIDAFGNTAYFIQVNKGKKSLALKVSPKGKVSIYDSIV